jgi:hypothetical protein
MPTNTLYRLAGLAGVLSGVIVIVNAARRGGLIAENALTHAIAPWGAALALFALTGLYLWQRERAGRLGLAGYATVLLGLTGLFGVEFTTHAVYQYLDPSIRDAILTGPARAYFLVVAATFLVGVVLFGIATWRAGVYPMWAVALFVLGFAPASLRGQVPDLVYVLGLTIGSIGTIGLSTSLLRTSTPVPTQAPAQINGRTT